MFLNQDQTIWLNEILNKERTAEMNLPFLLGKSNKKSAEKHCER